MTRKPSYRKIRKDYHQKDLCNPFFGHKKKGKSGRFTRCLIVIILLVLAAIIWFFFASPIWCIRNIEISGLTRMDSNRVQEIIWQQADQHAVLVFKRNNIFLFPEEESAKMIKDEYNLVNVSIKKRFPKTLKIEVQERPYAFIFQEGEELIHASADGFIIREQPVTDEDKAKYFIIENKAGSLVSNTNKINIKEDYLHFLLSLGTELQANQELPLERIIIDQESNMATVKLISGPAVYFSANDVISDQIKRLLLVKKEKIKDNFSKVNYIDLRYGDRIFINPDLN